MNWNIFQPLAKLFAPAAIIPEATPVRSFVTRRHVERANLRLQGKLPPSPLTGLSPHAQMLVLGLPPSQRYANPPSREEIVAAGRKAMQDMRRTIDI